MSRVKGKTPVEEPDRIDEAWVQAVTPDQAVRVRSLGHILQRGAHLTEARLIEAEDGTWSMLVRLSDRPGEFRLNLYKSAAPKTYKDVALAFATLRDDFGYYGPIILSTDKGIAARSPVGSLDD